ncbi:MAG: hypothetical protein IPK19_17015 [Chloroflexi bacterium]|nr:hypothetical protein [Chloroflexota bacterium]
MIWHFIFLGAQLLGDNLRFSRLAPDAKTVEHPLLRQQLLIVPRCMVFSEADSLGDSNTLR